MSHVLKYAFCVVPLLSVAFVGCVAGAGNTPSEGGDVEPDGVESEPTSDSPQQNPQSGEMTIFLDGTETLPLEPVAVERPEVTIIEELPSGFVSGQTGGWHVVGALSEVTFDESAECANVLRGISRDHKTSHVDFNNDILAEAGFKRGIVSETLGANRKPEVGALQGAVTSAGSFAEWFNNVEGVNQPFAIDLWLEPVGDLFVFDSSEFFPLQGYGYSADCADHCDWTSEPGFSFTTEIHTSFQYQGGEVFNFSGDDDVWVFINNQLVVDLGGLHVALDGSVDVDSLGLTVGEVYPLDFFHAERRFAESNFRIETSLDFSDCGEILIQDVVVR